MAVIDQFGGLNTDTAPDRLGTAALDVRNCVPASAQTIGPRLGTELVAHYRPLGLGRNLVADALPGATGEGILLIEANRTGTGEDEVTVRRIEVFRPEYVPPEYAPPLGLDESLMYGVIN
jgi:hypothetical protein